MSFFISNGRLPTTLQAVYTYEYIYRYICKYIHTYIYKYIFPVKANFSRIWSRTRLGSNVVLVVGGAELARYETS